MQVLGGEADDGSLVAQLRIGDAAAFAALYDRYAPQVHGVARVILRDEHLAEEATHDVFLGLWRQPQAFDPARGPFVAWLLRIARNRAIDLVRRRREEPFAVPPRGEAEPWTHPVDRLVDPEPDPADQAVGRFVGQEVRAALARLSPDHRRLLELAYFGGLTQREIAERLDRPLGTVKTQIRTAMQRLADLLEGFDPSSDQEPRDQRQ
jgi:RNA polymerase sigma-70 factor (ECF subfamily)